MQSSMRGGSYLSSRTFLRKRDRTRVREGKSLSFSNFGFRVVKGLEARLVRGGSASMRGREVMVNYQFDYPQRFRWRGFGFRVVKGGE